jgi:hypothetical protein
MMLFDDVDFGATFSPCRKFRFELHRIYNKDLPLVMFIGLNPSTANEDNPDNTVKSCTRIAIRNGYGGFYILNCFPYVSTNPDDLKDFGNTKENDEWLLKIAAKCKDVVFAYGDFKVLKQTGRDVEIQKMFPNAKALHINKNGSPKHPLYCKSDTKFVDFK